ncbi:hypothetical protein CFC21_085345 [Triticum aestivum]|uniref:HMA domain-containing protein n=2 Tax=Triticum aestivum TaxID=4565 RepID=A0A9R1IBZ4_WHEAT|nr:uncharacterized protein LOC123176724 [Triticum aestivum]KAF7081393.1 hypothetical protein CFC21_085337 [Triticum aestivum]KAF7081394.1 hypothetical protein CFC21_085338 [Triticum aestivum]KAF7081402.1 hypothetical protein CFC21_085345 [Triticum aestivum]
MGNAGSNGGEKAIAREMVLKVAMHCRCEGCTPKVRSAVRSLTLARGVVKVLDQSATEATEEVRLLATADPERLRRSLHEATGKKKVDLVLIPPNPVKPGLVDAAPDPQRQPRPPVLREHGGNGKRNHHQQLDLGAYPCPPASYHPGQLPAPPSGMYDAYPAPAPFPPGYYYCPPSAPPCPAGHGYY